MFGSAADEKNVCKSEVGLVRVGANLTPWLHLFHFPVSGFMMYCKSELDKSVLKRVSLLGSSLEMEMFAFTVSVH